MIAQFRSEVFLKQDIAAILAAIEGAATKHGEPGPYLDGYCAALADVRTALHIETAELSPEWSQAVAEAERKQGR